MNPTTAPSPASSRRPLALLLVLMGGFQPQFPELLLQRVPPCPTSHEPSFQPPSLGFGGPPPLGQSLGSSARPQSTRPSPPTLWWSISAQQGLYPRELGSSGVHESGSGKHDKMFSGTRFPRSPRENPDANRPDWLFPRSTPGPGTGVPRSPQEAGFSEPNLSPPESNLHQQNLEAPGREATPLGCCCLSVRPHGQATVCCQVLPAHWAPQGSSPRLRLAGTLVRGLGVRWTAGHQAVDG